VADIPDQRSRLAQPEAAGTSTGNATAKPPTATAAPAQGVMRVPAEDAVFMGRQAEVQQLLDALGAGHATTARRSSCRVACVIAQGGLGKSSLAVAVAWQLRRQGRADAGAVFVDLREAATAQDLNLRFCSALDMPAVS
jgi:Mrp family chromosome partitioning ATPase